MKSILSNITQLQPYFEVKESIQRLTNHGYKCVALSNGGLKALKRQMDFSGLSSVFSTIYSVELVKKF